MPSPEKVRSPSISIEFYFNLVTNKIGSGPIYLDENVTGPSNPFFVLDILEPTRSTYDDLYALTNISCQFIEDLKHVIISCLDIKMYLANVEEALGKVVGIRDTIEATCHELETLLRELRVELTTVKNIQAKVKKELMAKKKKSNVCQLS